MAVSIFNVIVSINASVVIPAFVFAVITSHDQILFVYCPLADTYLSWSMRVEVSSENNFKKSNK
jgi:hypothetical protein